MRGTSYSGALQGVGMGSAFAKRPGMSVGCKEQDVEEV